MDAEEFFEQLNEKLADEQVLALQRFHLLEDIDKLIKQAESAQWGASILRGAGLKVSAYLYAYPRRWASRAAMVVRRLKATFSSTSWTNGKALPVLFERLYRYWRLDPSEEIRFGLYTLELRTLVHRLNRRLPWYRRIVMGSGLGSVALLVAIERLLDWLPPDILGQGTALSQGAAAFLVLLFVLSFYLMCFTLLVFIKLACQILYIYSCIEPEPFGPDD